MRARHLSSQGTFSASSPILELSAGGWFLIFDHFFRSSSNAITLATLTAFRKSSLHSENREPFSAMPRHTKKGMKAHVFQWKLNERTAVKDQMGQCFKLGYYQAYQHQETSCTDVFNQKNNLNDPEQINQFGQVSEDRLFTGEYDLILLVQLTATNRGNKERDHATSSSSSSPSVSFFFLQGRE